MNLEKLEEIQSTLEANAGIDWDCHETRAEEEFSAVAEILKSFIKEEKDMLPIKRLGNYVSEDDVHEAYNKLLAQSEKDGSVMADDVVMMWEPLEFRYTVDQLMGEIL